MELRGFKLALRRLIKDSNHTLINVIGLTVSISFAFLIFIFVAEQLSYDKQFPNAENIYRISSDFRLNGHRDVYSNSPRPMGKTLVEEFPSIVTATKIVGYNGLQNHRGFLWFKENYVSCEHLYAVDSNFLKVFDLSLIKGDKNALNHPNQAIISKSFAKKLFGQNEAMGQIIRLENQSKVQIAGIFEDLPNATYMPFEVLVSYTTLYNTPENEIWWYGAHVYTYIKTSPSFTPEDVYSQWDNFFNKYMRSTFEELNGTATIIIQPMLDLYLTPEFIWEPYPHSDLTNIRIFASIGVFLLIVAGFNYTNLALSHSYYRIEEIRTKRVLGATKIHLIKQNLTEALLMALFVALLAFSLVGTVLPVFDEFTNRRNEFELITLSNLGAIFGLSILVTLLSSIYPSMKMAMLTDKNSKPTRLGIRKLFVTGQLTLAILVIISTIIVIDQLTYVKNMDPGFDKDDLMIVFIRDRQIKKNPGAFQNELNKLSGVVSTSRIDEIPSSGPNEFTYSMQNKDGDYESIPSQTFEAGLNFVPTMGLDLLAGRTFKEQDDEFTGVIINEFLAKKMGREPHEMIGTKLRFGSDDEVERSVIGVVKNFKISSAQEPIQAMTIGYRKVTNRYLLVRLSKQNQQEVIDQIKLRWNDTGSTLPLQYTLMSDEFNGLLQAEDRLFELLIVGSFLIILIACLGLVGLVSQTIVHRTKEIGIRKVVGAGSSQLYFLLQKDFLKTLAVSFALGSIAAWYIGKMWLEGYSYRIDMDYSQFLLAGFISLCIVVFTLSFHILKAIRSNPVDSLRDE